MSISLNPVLKDRKFEVANAIAILSLVSSLPLTDELNPAQQRAALKDKLDKLFVIDSTIGAPDPAGFTTATTDPALNPGGYTNVVAAIMDILGRLGAMGSLDLSNLLNTIGATGTAAFAAATTDANLNPSGYANVVAAIMDILARLDAVNAPDLTALIAALGASDASSFTTATTSPILNPSGYTSVVAAIMDILSRLNAQVPGAADKQNVLTVSPQGGQYTTISAALTAIAGGGLGIPAGNNRFMVNVFPGIYNDNIIVADYVDIVGADINSVVINGSVEKNSLNAGCVTNLTIRSSNAATFIVGVGGQYILKNLRIENSAGGSALLANDADVTLCSCRLNSNGIALMQMGGKVTSRNTYMTGSNGVAVNNGGTFIFAGGEIQAQNTGIYCGGSSEVVTMFGVVDAQIQGIKTEGGILRLLGGVVLSPNSIDANDFSTVHMGAIATPPQTQNLALATVIPNVLANSIGFEDSLGLFNHSLAVSKSLDKILIELGQARVNHQNEINTLHDKSNHNEHDSIVDAAMLQISLMAPEYTLFMVDSFMDINTNTYSSGTDKAVISAEHSILAHQGNTESLNFYKHDYIGNLSGKNKVYLKSALQKSASDSLGASDWQIDYYVEITGGRYASNPLVFLLHSVTALNWNSGRVEKECVLAVPTAGTKLDPMITNSELVSIKIAIKADSATAQATPVVRSFVAFM